LQWLLAVKFFSKKKISFHNCPAYATSIVIPCQRQKFLNMVTNSIGPIVDQLNLQTRLLQNVISGINDEAAHKRLEGSPNHAAWITGHLVSSRYDLGNMIGINDKEPFPELLGNRKAIQPDLKYPSMSELTKGWDEIGKKLTKRLSEMTDEELSKPTPFPIPTGNNTILGLAAFISHHEAYSIGQLSIFRRFLGLSAMSYK
jgi:hypothetical protein